MLKIGFTGTQKGMTAFQKEAFIQVIRFATSFEVLGPKKRQIEFHHGDCIGADTDAHNVLADDSNCRIIIHPPDKQGKRANNSGDEYRAEKPYLERNKDIVQEAAFLIACPRTCREEVRSGTWATVRCAERMEKQVIIIYPNGERYIR